MIITTTGSIREPQLEQTLAKAFKKYSKPTSNNSIWSTNYDTIIESMGCKFRCIKDAPELIYVNKSIQTVCSRKDEIETDILEQFLMDM